MFLYSSIFLDTEPAGVIYPPPAVADSSSQSEDTNVVDESYPYYLDGLDYAKKNDWKSALTGYQKAVSLIPATKLMIRPHLDMCYRWGEAVAKTKNPEEIEDLTSRLLSYIQAIADNKVYKLQVASLYIWSNNKERAMWIHDDIKTTDAALAYELKKLIDRH